MQILEQLTDRARKRRGTVVFPEGDDGRIVAAARRLMDDGIARPVLLGSRETVEEAARSAGVAVEGLDVVDPVDSERSGHYAASYVAARPKTKPGAAARQMRKPLYHAGMMVRCGDADAMVAGVANPTARVIQAAMLTIGPAAGIETPSSYFLMVLPDRVLLFADCAVNVEPDEAQLADIALASAASADGLLGRGSRVALLGGEASAARVASAAARAAARAPERQIGALAAPEALEPGRAEVLVFPDLNAGNIGYKLTQYLAGAQAIGPFLQGFARPVSDLSRGAAVDDIVTTTVVLLAAG